MNKFDAVIVLAGPDFDRLSFQNIGNNVFLIAVDGGLNHLKKCKRSVNLHLGDMDSFIDDENLPPVEDVLIFPREKDDSDFVIALNYLLGRNCKNVAVFGAVGGRVDHFLQIYETAIEYCKKDLEITIFSNQENIIFTAQNLFIDDLPLSTTISVFAGSLICNKVSYTGLKYPLNGYTMQKHHPIGLSNLTVHKKISITHDDGVLVIVINKK